MADLDRETLFANEVLVIGMLQAVSGGSIIAALAQAEILIKYGGRLSFFVFVTAVSLALVFALLAAYWKHQYKMWDVKSSVSKGVATYHGTVGDGNKELEYLKEAEERHERANKYLRGMRRVILLAVLFVLLGVGELVASFWYHELCKSGAPNTALNLTRGADAPLAG